MDDLVSANFAVVGQQLPNVADVLAGQIKASSIAMYKRDVQAYLDFAHRTARYELDSQTLISWRDDLVLNTTLSPHTINRMMSAVRRLILEGYRRNMVDVSTKTAFTAIPGVKVSALLDRLKPNSRTRIEPEDMRRLCESPDASTLVGLRDVALLATLASSGLRAKELADLQQGHIKKRKSGYIIEVMGKTDIKPRDAHLSTEAYQHIKAWLKVRPIEAPYVFTQVIGRGDTRATDKPLSANAIWKMVIHYAEKCGLEHIKPHDFRRFVGTQLAAIDIRKAQKALGHKSIEVTARHYVLDEIEPGLTDNLY